MEIETSFDRMPAHIRRKMLLRQYEDGGVINPDVFRRALDAGHEGGGFTWAHTPEGHDYWYDVVINGKFPPIEEEPTIAKAELGKLLRTTNQIGKELIISIVVNFKMDDGSYYYPETMRRNMVMYINS